MKLTVQRKLAGDIMKCSPGRISFTPEQLPTIKEAITKADIRALIGSGAITRKPEVGNSRGRIRKTASQKAKGRQKGQGSRKGTANARSNSKTEWINKVRAQRELIKELKGNEKIDVKTYRKLYGMITGGYFRNRRHIKLYLGENNLVQ